MRRGLAPNAAAGGEPGPISGPGGGGCQPVHAGVLCPASRASGPQGMIEDEALGHAADARAIVDRHGAAGMLVDVDDEV